MKNEVLSKSTISKIFSQNNITNVNEIHKLDIGFTNDIYIVNDQYILKVCIDEKNEEHFNRESFSYDFFKDMIPVPNIIVSDTSKVVIDKYYMIYEKIAGDNLFSKWHLFSHEDRKYIVSQLADIINCVNAADYQLFLNHFKMDEVINWHNIRYNSLKEKLTAICSNRILENRFIDHLEEYISKNHNTLLEQKIGLTYTDLHFDNVLISANKVTALLDFERVDILSIDYALDTIKRLSEYPYLYACEEYEEFVKGKDYENLIEWFKEFCPNLFNFKHLKTRLDLYSIEYDMRLLLKFPESEGLKKRLAKTVMYNF